MPMDVSLLNLLNHCFKLELKECLNPEIQEHFACEIRLQENVVCGIRNTAQVIWNPTVMGIQNPSSSDKDWNPVLKLWFHGMESGIQGCLGFLYMGRCFSRYVTLICVALCYAHWVFDFVCLQLPCFLASFVTSMFIHLPTPLLCSWCLCSLLYITSIPRLSLSFSTIQ